jgi:hypothetical protein
VPDGNEVPGSILSLLRDPWPLLYWSLDEGVEFSAIDAIGGEGSVCSGYLLVKTVQKERLFSAMRFLSISYGAKK